MDEKTAFISMDLSEDDRKHIEIRENGVSLRFPLKYPMVFEDDRETVFLPDEKRRLLESGAQAQFQKIITEFWDEEAGRGGVKFRARLRDYSEAEFFKEAKTEEEVRGAVLALLNLKRKLGVV